MDTAPFPQESIPPVAGLSPDFLRTHGLLPLLVQDTAVQVAAAVPVRMAALDALTIL